MSDNALPSRDDAWKLLTEFNSEDRLLKHALAVEAAMRYQAAKQGGDVEAWGLAGLVHDLDYQQWPDQHCVKSAQLLTERSYPAQIVRAVLSHGWPGHTDAQPETPMEKTLYAVDELTGLVMAAALVRPSRSVMDLEVKSVLKKWKDARFAAGVDRSVIDRGAEMMGVSREELIADVIAAMRTCAVELGLAGSTEHE